MTLLEAKIQELETDKNRYNSDHCGPEASLCRDLIKALRALEFYADGNSWYRPISVDESEKANYLCSRREVDLTENGVGPDKLAGKIARQAIAEIVGNG